MESRFYAYSYLEAVKGGAPSGVSTLREILKQEGWSIFGVNNAMISTGDVDVVAEVLESFAFRASGPLADILQANDAEDNLRPTLIEKKTGVQKTEEDNSRKD